MVVGLWNFLLGLFFRTKLLVSGKGIFKTAKGTMQQETAQFPSHFALPGLQIGAIIATSYIISTLRHHAHDLGVAVAHINTGRRQVWCSTGMKWKPETWGRFSSLLNHFGPWKKSLNGLFFLSNISNAQKFKPVGHWLSQLDLQKSFHP